MIDHSGRDVVLEVDGGIRKGTAAEVVRAGATMLVAGSAVFGNKDYTSAIRALREDAS
jgi:ribulose-phosphate 3-epimerase